MKIFSGRLSFDGDAVPEFERDGVPFSRQSFYQLCGEEFDGKMVLITIVQICGELVGTPPAPCTLRVGHGNLHWAMVRT